MDRLFGLLPAMNERAGPDAPRTSPSRRNWMRTMAAAGMLTSRLGARSAGQPGPRKKPVPIIDITDLYHPCQDPGDNFDLIAAYALPGVDLKAVILDATENFRGKVATDSHGKVVDDKGPRDPGFIPVTQLNYIFNRNVPCGLGPLSALTSPDDRKAGVPAFQQTGVELILSTLRASPDKVDVLSFGSARALAVAYNREPELLRRKIGRIHLSAGTSTPTYMEWNVDLDPNAIICLLHSQLPILLYPCATKDGAFSMDRHNTFYELPNLELLRKVNPRLRSYLMYAFTQSSRVDFLHAMDGEWPQLAVDEVCRRKHSVWETAIWTEAAGLKLVRRKDGTHRLVPAAEVAAGDTVLPNEFRPCRTAVGADGNYSFTLTGGPSNFRVYDRVDAEQNAVAMREALPALYASFRPDAKA